MREGNAHDYVLVWIRVCDSDRYILGDSDGCRVLKTMYIDSKRFLVASLRKDLIAPTRKGC